MNKSVTRILMLLENNPYPGDLRVFREAKSLTAAGFDVTVISPTTKNRPWHETIDGVRVYRFRAPSSADGILGYVWEYGYSLVATFFLSMLVFLRHGFDVIHAHNPPDLYVLIAMFYRVMGKKFVFDHHDLAPEMYRARFAHGGNRILFQTLVFFEKLSLRMANHVIVTNESYKANAIRRGKVPERRITIVRNGPDLNRVRPRPMDQELRGRAGTILGYVGEIGHQDGLDYLLRSLRCLIDKLGRDDFHCVIIGNGEAWNDLVQLNDELNLNEHVWLAGRIQDPKTLFRYLSTADICVAPDPSNPYTDQSTMVKMMEYMALSKPIVAFDLSEHRASAADAALYATPNDELEFAKQIVALMDDQQLRHEMGIAGRKRIDEQLSWDHQKDRLIRVYKALGCQSERANKFRDELPDELTTNEPSNVEVAREPALRE